MNLLIWSLLAVTSIEKPAITKDEFPELFSSKGQIVMFGTPSCWPCIRQKVVLRSHPDYNVRIYDVTKVKGERLYNALKLTKNPIPTIVILESGVPKKRFLGFTKWEKIKPFADIAKKQRKIRLWLFRRISKCEDCF